MIHGDQLLALLFTRHIFGMVSVGHKKQGTRPSDGKWVNGEQKTRQKKARAERVLTHTLLLHRRNVKRGCRAEAALSGLHQYDDTQRYTTMHTHTNTQSKPGEQRDTLWVVSNFVVRVLFHRETQQDSRRGQQTKQEQQLKAARRCTHWKSLDPLAAGSLGSGQLPVWTTRWRRGETQRLVSTN